jgi:hypothetical protein
MITVNLYTPRKCTNASFNVKQKSLKALESSVPTMRKLRNGRLDGLAIQIRQRMQKPVTDNAVYQDLAQCYKVVRNSERFFM